ncbi:NAD(P)-dependent oxidoreductase [Pandoraea pulmonicola]|uniref:NAD-dependent epimerase n=1 Tax=Pandoraea pulmonicola TaxID=93221 RepID=A0AAJ4ZH11_PANPU|nr:NAD(P)-binding oxidoreductase [Pandoraea pulmonicola]AJC22549.1 NAD-dependent epimerase [Pandoraea pulmonicola]SUA93268.1 Putative NADH-flavin reductase [Pandoraea pulmonicola]
MKVLVVGATGATGRQAVKALLARGCKVTALVRSPGPLIDLASDDRLSLVHAGVAELSPEDLARHVSGCAAVVSCLGHNMTFRGMFGEPRRLVTHATRNLCAAIGANAPSQPVRVILMNTAGIRNGDLREPVPLLQSCVLGLLHVLLPPHADNVRAADFLRVEVGRDRPDVQWTVVRPDSLIDEDGVSRYIVHPSPVRSALFNPGKTSRVNVADFMAELATDDTVWARWKFQMPVIYNDVD